jgi:hypothetical protein
MPHPDLPEIHHMDAKVKLKPGEFFSTIYSKAFKTDANPFPNYIAITNPNDFRSILPVEFFEHITKPTSWLTFLKSERYFSLVVSEALSDQPDLIWWINTWVPAHATTPDNLLMKCEIEIDGSLSRKMSNMSGRMRTWINADTVTITKWPELRDLEGRRVRCPK